MRHFAYWSDQQNGAGDLIPGVLSFGDGIFSL